MFEKASNALTNHGKKVMQRMAWLLSQHVLVFRVDSYANHFPPHWGDPPKIQTKDISELPGGFGEGSSTLKDWIREKIETDRANGDNTGKDSKFGSWPRSLEQGTEVADALIHYSSGELGVSSRELPVMVQPSPTKAVIPISPKKIEGLS